VSPRALHGGIQGLLRLHSAVLWRGTPCTIVALEAGQAMVAGPRTGQGWVTLDELELDLSQPTAWWHAALWIVAETARLASHPALSAAEIELVEQIAWGEDLSEDDVAELREMALRLVPHAG